MVHIRFWDILHELNIVFVVCRLICTIYLLICLPVYFHSVSDPAIRRLPGSVLTPALEAVWRTQHASMCHSHYTHPPGTGTVCYYNLQTASITTESPFEHDIIMVGTYQLYNSSTTMEIVNTVKPFFPDLCSLPDSCLPVWVLWYTAHILPHLQDHKEKSPLRKLFTYCMEIIVQPLWFSV